MYEYITYDDEGKKLIPSETKRKFIKLCRIGDIYFDDELYEEARNAANDDRQKMLGHYFRQINIQRRYKDLTYEDYDRTLIPEEYDVDDDGDFIPVVTKKQIRMWGEDREEWEFEMLDNLYDYLMETATETYENVSVDVRIEIKSYAMIRVELQKLQRNGYEKASDLKSLQELGQKILQSVGLTHEQIQKRKDTGEEAMGAWIKHIEDNEPISEGLEPFEKDENEIKLYLEAMSGQLAKSLGISNNFADSLEYFEKKYGVDSE